MKTLLFILALVLGPGALASSQNDSGPVLSDAELAQILAPIALYPDSVLSHVLIAATYPLEVVQAGRWLSKHPDPESAAQALANQDWDASVKALTPFPELIRRLNEDLDWMRDLGDAFLADEQRLLAGVQSLRAQAEQADSFDNAEHIQLSREQGNIIIEATDNKIVYIPYYDSRQVYGNWRYAQHPPHQWIGWESHWHASHSNYLDRHHSPFDWHSGVYLSTSFFFNAVHWSDRRIRVANHHSRYWRQHSLRRTFDRTKHRRQLRSDHSAGYWRHNPKHRRGVAYAGQRKYKRDIIDRAQRQQRAPSRAAHAALAKRYGSAVQRTGERRQSVSSAHQPRVLQQLRTGKHHSEQHQRQRITPNKLAKNKRWQASASRQSKHAAATKKVGQQRSRPATAHIKKDRGHRSTAIGKSAQRSAVKRPRYSNSHRQPRLASGHHRQR